MIVGTAGHIDHGKTALIRALTGVDTDRLPEERARGMSIELGFAYLDLPGDHRGRIGFVDVPGHERLVHTMLAGATGIDFALLVVAVDDGVMPQTREHLAVLSLLGLGRGAVVLTKIDRVPQARVVEVQAEVAALLAGTPLAGAPVRAVSSLSGAGVEALRQLLFDAARQRDGAARSSLPHIGGGELLGSDPALDSPTTGNSRPAADKHPAVLPGFRLAIDRSFSLPGTGTIVTGTVHAGRLRVGDELRLAPANDGAPRVRVRSLHAQNREVAEAGVGERCAVGLAGVDRDDATRGRWLTDPDIVVATSRLDVRLTLWRGEARALRSGTPVHVHIGTGDSLGTATVLRLRPAGTGEAGDASDACADANWGDTARGDVTRADASRENATREDATGAVDILRPGGQADVQIVLRVAIAAWRGDRVVLRDASASRTIAGGIVLDPFAPARHRRSTQRGAELDAAALPSASARLVGLLGAAPHGVSIRRWLLAEGLVAAGRPACPPGSLLARDSASGEWALGAAHCEALAAAALGALRVFHAGEPELPGPDPARLRRLAAPRLPAPLWRALAVDLQQQGRLVANGAHLHLPEHGLRLSATDERLAQRIVPLLASAGFDGCWARDLARVAGESEALMRTTLARLAQRGQLHQVVKDLCYPAAAITRLAGQARAIAATGSGGHITAARFRDATGLGRKRAIQILEYFDRIGFLRRVGDSHRLRDDTSLFAADDPA